MTLSGIYKIQSKVKPKRIYIGSAVNLHKREKGHFSYLKRNKHANKKLQNHYNKYGSGDLVFSILLICEKELLMSNEQFFMDSYPIYFNECRIAGRTIGLKRSEDWKKMISERNKGNKYCQGYKHSEDAKLRISKFQKGRIKSEIEKTHLSEGHKGYVATEETRRRMSEKHLGNKYSLGILHTEEWKKEQSKRATDYWKLKKSQCQKSA